MIEYKGNRYSWTAVYFISGLCEEDFKYDSEGSWEHFKEKILELEKLNET
jgi:hypothetical protein